MAFDQLQLVLQFCSTVMVLLAAGYGGVAIHRALSKPRGTYANGQPERRKRQRIQLADPATLTPRIVPPGTSI